MLMWTLPGGICYPVGVADRSVYKGISVAAPAADCSDGGSALKILLLAIACASAAIHDIVQLARHQQIQLTGQSFLSQHV